MFIEGVIVSNILLKAESISKSFKGNKEKIVLKNINIGINHGEIVGIVGDSGQGKSTLARIICGTIKPDSGKVWFENTLIFSDKKSFDKKFRTSIQLIPQQPFLSLDPKQKVIDAIVEPMIDHKIFKTKDQAYEHAFTLLESVQLERELAQRYPSQISGGQAQRIVIARALSISPKLLIADESTSMLDTLAQAQVVQIYRKLVTKNNVSILFISHDMPLVRAVCSRIYAIKNGTITPYDNQCI